MNQIKSSHRCNKDSGGKYGNETNLWRKARYKDLYYLHRFELWHGNIGEEEDAEEWMRNRHKLVWSSWSAYHGVLKMNEAGSWFDKKFGWIMLI